MSEIRFRVEEKINEILVDLLKKWGSKSTQVLIPEVRRQILAIPEIAIVDREAELPEVRHLGWGGKLELYTQQDILSAGWVKEVKE